MVDVVDFESFVAGVVLFDDELHAVVSNASATPATSIDRIRFMVDPLFPALRLASLRCGP